LAEPNETVETKTLERTEDEVLRKEEKKKKARLRTRGPYRKASTKNLPISDSDKSE